MEYVFQGKLEEINEKEKNELLIKINNPDLFTFYYRYSVIERMIMDFFAYFLLGGSAIYIGFNEYMPKLIKNLAKNNYTNSYIFIGIFSVITVMIIGLIYILTTDFIKIISKKYNFFATDKEYIYSFEGKNKITIIPWEKAGQLSNFDNTIKYKSNLASTDSIYIGETTKENLKKLRKFYNSNVNKKESTENILETKPQTIQKKELKNLIKNTKFEIYQKIPQNKEAILITIMAFLLTFIPITAISIAVFKSLQKLLIELYTENKFTSVILITIVTILFTIGIYQTFTQTSRSLKKLFKNESSSYNFFATTKKDLYLMKSPNSIKIELKNIIKAEEQEQYLKIAYKTDKEKTNSIFLKEINPENIQKLKRLIKQKIFT